MEPERNDEYHARQFDLGDQKARLEDIRRTERATASERENLRGLIAWATDEPPAYG